MEDRISDVNPKPAIRQASPPKAGESQIYPLQSGLARHRRVQNPKVMSLAGRQSSIEMREQGGALLIRVKVQPKASADAIVGEHAGALKIRVAAAPENGRANRAAVKFLAGKLGLRRSDITIVSGEHSRDKLFAIQGLTKGEILHRLQSLQTILE